MGKPDTLPNIVKPFSKVKVTFTLSENEENVTFYISGKHRNRVHAVTEKFIDRYNRIMDITCNIMRSQADQ